MIRYPKLNEDEIKGGLADDMSPESIAKKHNVSVDKINKELEMGIEVEYEHVDDKSKAREIALDHLYEFPDYYTKLKKMEKEGEKSLKEQTIKKLLREALLSVTDETADSTTYDIYHNKRKAGTITVGPAPSVMGEDALEILKISFDEGYGGRKLVSDAISALWSAYPDVNKLVIMPKQKSRPFWQNIGFNRLNDKFDIRLRGH